jgi:hypothetical protein
LSGSSAKRCRASSCETSSRTNGYFSCDHLLHLGLEGREILGREGRWHLEVVVEAVIDGGAEADLGIRDAVAARPWRGCAHPSAADGHARGSNLRPARESLSVITTNRAGVPAHDGASVIRGLAIHLAVRDRAHGHVEQRRHAGTAHPIDEDPTARHVARPDGQWTGGCSYADKNSRVLPSGSVSTSQLRPRCA